MAAEALRDRLQTTLGSAYTIDRELGGGGMSRVFVARDGILRREVVVKVLPPELLAGVNLERFRREILVAAGLQNPHIVPVLTAGETDGVPWFTMPFVQGESLRDRLARGPLPIAETVNVLRDVAKALAYAHEHGVVHRDIKPDNVLLTGGTAVVTDFGIAKALSVSRTNGGDEPTATRGALTQVGMSIGTPLYMAPEQAAADPKTDHRADLYAFGCLAYELLVGRPPFAGRSPQQLLAAHMSESPRPIAELRRDTPPLVADLVMSCLEKNPTRRPATAADVVRVLDLATTASGNTASAASVLLGRRISMPVALVAWVIVFGAAWIVAKAAIIVIGLPSWVVPGALIVAALGLPAILFTAFVQRTAHRALTRTPRLTPGGTAVPQSTMATIALKASPHVSWKRTTRGGMVAFAAFALFVAAFMVLRTLGIGPAATLFSTGKLNAHDRVLVADFTAPSADSSLGAVVAEGVRTNLMQSRVIGVVPANAVADGLRRMQRPTNTTITVAVARELAQRDGVKAVVDGSVTPAGQGFILTLRLVSADSGTVLATFQEAARDATDVIPAIDRVTRDLRDKVGESLKAVHASPPLMQVTTASLPALRKFTEGMMLHYRYGRYAAAAAAFEAAIRLDSGFAMAYERAANSWGNAGLNRARTDSLSAIAFRLRDRLPALERALVEEGYYAYRGQRDSTIAATERAVAIDPGQSTVWNQLGLEYTDRHEYARAESAYRRAIAIGDGNIQPWGNLPVTLVDDGQFTEAQSAINAAMERFHASSAGLAIVAATMAFMRGRYDSAAKLLDSAASMPRDKTVAAAQQLLASFDKTRGQLASAEQRLAAANAADMKAGFSVRAPSAAAIPLTIDSIRTDFWIRERPAAEAARRLDALVARFPKTGALGLQPGDLIAIAGDYAMVGRVDRARALLSRFDRDVRDSVTVHNLLPARRWADGEIALAEHRFDEAIADFRALNVAYDGYPLGTTCVRDALLGRAFDLAGKRDSAIAALERYVSTPFVGRLSLDANYLAASEKRLGELYEAKGDYAKAAHYYQTFVDLWQRADPDLQPHVAEVRMRLAHLGKSTG